MNTQKQTGKLIACIAENLPIMEGDIRQGWIDNPRGLKKFLSGLNPPCTEAITVVKHIIDLSASPQLPFDRAEVVKHESEINGKKVVEIELRSDDNLYIDGKKIVLHLSERQMGDKLIVGHELRKELEGGEQVLLNSNVLDYLCDHPELFPEHWKKDKNGETRYIYFWGSVFRDPSVGDLYVRYLYWDGGGLLRSYGWLGVDWVCRYPSASVAS